MSATNPLVTAWVRDVLTNEGQLPVAGLVEQFVPVEDLRELARRKNVAVKGYRIDRAPAKKLAPLLTDPHDPSLLEAACELLLDRLQHSAAGPKPPTAEQEEERAANLGLLRLREQDLEDVRRQLENQRKQAGKHRRRETELQQTIEQEAENAAHLRAEVQSLHRRLEVAEAAPRVEDPDRSQIHELQRELEAVMEADEGLRRLLAIKQARIRELEEQVTELTQLIPKGKRKKQPKPEAPKLSDGFRVPYFRPSFYKSLEGKDRRSIEKAIQAILLFCTEGPSYPGLEAKPLEGQDVWSIRASIKLRVYYLPRDNGDVDFVMLVDREDQNTALRKLKER